MKMGTQGERQEQLSGSVPPEPVPAPEPRPPPEPRPIPSGQPHLCRRQDAVPSNTRFPIARLGAAAGRPRAPLLCAVGSCDRWTWAHLGLGKRTGASHSGRLGNQRQRTLSTGRVKFFNAERGFGSMRPTTVPTPALDREGWVAASVSVLGGCWYRDPVHRPAVGWCPTSWQRAGYPR